MKKKVKMHGDEIVKNLSLSNLAHINACLDKANAFTYALHAIAASDGLEDLGDDDAFIILDEAVVQLQEIQKVINEGVEKKERRMP
jgi:hypothetical protein